MTTKVTVDVTGQTWEGDASRHNVLTWEVRSSVQATKYISIDVKWGGRNDSEKETAHALLHSKTLRCLTLFSIQVSRSHKPPLIHLNQVIIRAANMQRNRIFHYVCTRNGKLSRTQKLPGRENKTRVTMLYFAARRRACYGTW
jgi:hypothetical protein